MEKVARAGISFPKGLLKKFDEAIKKKGYQNRSEAINDLIRGFIHKEKENEQVFLLKIIYDHRLGHFNTRISELLHEYHCMIKTSSSYYIDHHNCLETIVIKGIPERIHILLKKLKTNKGIKKISLEKI